MTTMLRWKFRQIGSRSRCVYDVNGRWCGYVERLAPAQWGAWVRFDELSRLNRDFQSDEEAGHAVMRALAVPRQRRSRLVVAS